MQPRIALVLRARSGKLNVVQPMQQGRKKPVAGVAVRIKQAHAAAGKNVLLDHVQEQSRLARACRTDNVHMFEAGE